mgnify:CR=1 FL=1
MEITKDILYVGVNDHQVDLFEGQYIVPNGMAYNSYAIIDEKIASGIWPNIKYRKVIREGVPEEQILGYAERHKPLAIVMGTRGKDQKDADLIGSVTAEIIERSRVPVFTIPENILLNKIERFDTMKLIKKGGLI